MQYGISGAIEFQMNADVLLLLQWNDPRGGYIYSNNCGQRVILPNGDVQMSFTFGPEPLNLGEQHCHDFEITIKEINVTAILTRLRGWTRREKPLRLHS